MPDELLGLRENILRNLGMMGRLPHINSALISAALLLQISISI